MRLKTLWITLVVGSVVAGIAAAGNGLQSRQAGGPGGRGVVPLTEEAKDTILFMREEEKLARDVYLAMDDLWDANVFANIAASEQRHMDALGRIITLYGLEDPVGDNALGVFNDPDLTALYNDLITQGSVSLSEALKVGVRVEQVDIEDLEKALTMEGLPTTVRRVFTNLLAASRRHLAAFETCVETGGTECPGVACNGQGGPGRGGAGRQGNGCGGGGNCPWR